jgi:hypothetical protein
VTLKVVFYIDLISYVLPLWVGFSRMRYLDRAMRLFLLRLSIAALVDLVSLILAKMWIPNAWVIQLFHIWDVPLLLFIFSLLSRSTLYRALFKLAIVVYLGAFLIAKITFEPISLPDQYTYTGASLVLLIGSIMILYEVVSADGVDPFAEPWFWIGLAVIAYFAINIAIFSVWQWFVTLEYDHAIWLGVIQWTSNIIANCFIMVGYLRVKKA